MSVDTTAAEPQAPDVEDAPGAEETPDEPTGRRAQRLRAQEAVARAEAAESRLAAAQTREVHRLAATALAAPGDVLTPELGGVTLDELLDQDGVVDPDLVAEAAAAVAAQRPGLAVARPAKTGADFDGGARAPLPRVGGWASLFRGDR
ncbi:hypothetical protein FHN55_05060 [Streptomyces sp. NP160]|uniref:hypothetical protein n=1 Tax=Streptomyces sp. NP160 TaxID=2586637 RepID=UPI00111B9255|nr:hypothetical protein [Streptomyces sp. NP160]TNM69155.1 hypothetical protein FHN55_05060 [Streptomyces sp. NP160]